MAEEKNLKLLGLHCTVTKELKEGNGTSTLAAPRLEGRVLGEIGARASDKVHTCCRRK